MELDSRALGISMVYAQNKGFGEQAEEMDTRRLKTILILARGSRFGL